MIKENKLKTGDTLISYKPLLKLLIDRNIKKQDLKTAGISWGTISKFSTNEYVSLEVIDKLCNLLNCQPGDIIEHMPIQQNH